jgi:rhodanese-related sulfurtransferase
MRIPLVSFAVVLALVLPVPVCADDPVDGPMSPQTLAKRQRGFDPPALILDTRTPEEYAAGHVPGARLLPHDQVETAITSLQAFRDAEIVLYCRSGRRSALAEAVLREHGFSRLSQLQGSWRAWEAQGLPVARLDTGSMHGGEE